MSTRDRDEGGLWNRRDILKMGGALVVGSTLSSIASGEADSQSADPARPAANAPPAIEPSLVRIGIFLESFAGKTLEARLDAVKANGLDCVQLGMDSAGLPPMPDEITVEMIARIARESAARNIEIASLRGTFNMCHPDPDYRRGGVRRIGVMAAACQKLGTPRIHLCTGTRDRINMWKRHPDNGTSEAWRDMVACVRDAVEIAKPSGVTLAFEPEVNNIVDSAKKARQLLDEINSPQLKVCIDGSNLFHAGELAHQDDVLDEAFAQIGKDVVMAHAKDVSHDGDAGHEPAGHGKLDYERYISLMHANGFKGPLFLHGLNETQVPGCVAFLREKMAHVAAGLSKSSPTPK
jgi:sugar phosphate isomerase/epimerase